VLKAGSAVPALIEALKDANGQVRKMAALALGDIGPNAKAAVPTLIEALHYQVVFLTPGKKVPLPSAVVHGNMTSSFGRMATFLI